MNPRASRRMPNTAVACYLVRPESPVQGLSGRPSAVSALPAEILPARRFSHRSLISVDRSDDPLIPDRGNNSYFPLTI